MGLNAEPSDLRCARAVACRRVRGSSASVSASCSDGVAGRSPRCADSSANATNGCLVIDLLVGANDVRSVGECDVVEVSDSGYGVTECACSAQMCGNILAPASKFCGPRPSWPRSRPRSSGRPRWLRSSPSRSPHTRRRRISFSLPRDRWRTCEKQMISAKIIPAAPPESMA